MSEAGRQSQSDNATACPSARLHMSDLQDSSRPIRYPLKIAPTLQQLMASVDDVMSDMRRMLQEHMGTAVKRLRVQASAWQSFSALNTGQDRLEAPRPKLDTAVTAHTFSWTLNARLTS